MPAPVLPFTPESVRAPAPAPAVPASLLPSVLAGPGALLWLWVLPVGILLLLNLQGFSLISGNMEPQHLTMARLFGLAGVVNLAVGLALFVWDFRRSRASTSIDAKPAWVVPSIAVAVQVCYLVFSFAGMDDILPRSVTSWIYPEARFLFNQFAFAMLPLALGVLRLACLRSDINFGATIAGSLALVVGAPALLFLFFLLASPRHALWQISIPIIIAVVVATSLAMFVGVVRALMYGLRRVRAWSALGERLAVGLFALALPIAGLLLNREIDFPTDFQAWEVYTLVVVNTAILLFASFQHTRRPLLSFCLLCGTLPFSLYFFIVFLPYTPLSILALIVLGTGFLVLTPTLLFILHLHLLNQARRNPLLRLPARTLTLAGLGCAALLPAYFTLRALGDRTALHAALDYVYAPTLDRGGLAYPADLGNLERALHSHRNYKNGIAYPLLSDFYAWVVFDRLVLPDAKLVALETTFFGAPGSSASLDPVRSRRSRGSSVREQSLMPRAANLPHTVDVTRLAVRTAPADAHNTIVTLALTLTHTNATSRVGAEYLKTLPLPAGLFVNGFRLDVNGTPVPGRIFEKKTALWVYTMIRDSERRDPGLLYYRNPGELELRVFPVNPGTPAHVEIDFLVPRALSADTLPAFGSDPATVLAQLGTLLTPQLTHAPLGSVVAGGLDRLDLPPVEHEPYLHVIVDRSRDSAFVGDLAAALRTLQKKFPAARRACVTLAHHDATDLAANLTPIDELATRTVPSLDDLLPRSGALALDLVLARAIRQHRDGELDQSTGRRGLPPRPIFVILSGHIPTRSLDLEHTRQWADLVPSLELHELAADGAWLDHLSLGAPSTPLLRLGLSLRPLIPGQPLRFKPATAQTPLEYWSPADSRWQPVAGVAPQPATSPWSRAAALQLAQQDYARSPGDAPLGLTSLVQASRASGVLLASASYIVVENSAQWRMLEVSERQKLGQNTALAFRETPAPPAVWVVLAFGLWLAWRHRQKLRALRTAQPA